MKDTREKILKIALDMFGECGFNGVSTRDISKKANVNISAISYYFNNKEGLYRDVVKYVAVFIKDKFKNCIDIIKSCEHKIINEKSAIEILCLLLDNISENILKSNLPSISMILMREIIKPSIGTDVIYNELILPFHETLLKIVKCIVGTKLQNEQITVIIYTMLGQILGFATNKAMITKVLNVDTIDDNILSLIKETIKKQSIIILKSYKKEGKK